MHRMSPAQGSGAYLGQSDRPDLAGRLEISHRAHGVFDGNTLVPAMQIVQVDVLGPEISQRLLADGADPLGPAIDHAFAFATEEPAFARDDDVVRTPREHLADEFLVGAKS